jgi:hypothetical protein
MNQKNYNSTISQLPSANQHGHLWSWYRVAWMLESNTENLTCIAAAGHTNSDQKKFQPGLISQKWYFPGSKLADVEHKYTFFNKPG